jgi:hypothetical protein
MSLVGPGFAAVLHPACADPSAVVAVLADSYPESTPEGLPRLDQIIAAAQVTFAMSGFMALTVHAFVVEVYLYLTQAEANRLKRVSRERQIARGWSVPGPRAGWLTAETLGDCVEFEYKAVAKVDDGESAEQQVR